MSQEARHLYKLDRHESLAHKGEECKGSHRMDLVEVVLCFRDHDKEQ
jgi:hypothetical protein